MKKKYLTLLSIITVFAVVIGLIYNVGIFSSNKSEYVDVNYDYEGVESIELDVGLIDMSVVSGDKFNVHYQGEKKLLPKFEQNGSTVHITQRSENHFKAFGVNNVSSPSLIITVPEGTVPKNIKFDCGLGDAVIKGVSFEEMEINCALGNIELNDLTTQKLDIDANLGSVSLRNVDAGDIDAELSMGDFEASLVKDVNEYSYDVEISMGKGKIGGNEVSRTYKTNGQNGTIKIKSAMGNVEID